MTYLAFTEHVVALTRKGRKPTRIDLPAADVAELTAELSAKPQPKRCCCACHQHEPRQVTSGYVMTLIGVEVYSV